MDFYRRRIVVVVGGLSKKRSIQSLVLAAAALLLILAALFVAPPGSFPAVSYVHVEEDSTVRQVAALLKERGVVRSESFFIAMVWLFGGEVVAGEYFFPRAQSGITVARRLARGDHEIAAMRVTFPEGVRAREMAEILQRQIPDFDVAQFLWLSERDEGYLFPDTYFIFPGERAAVVHRLLRDNFERRVLENKELLAAIEKFGQPLEVVIVMASLLEKEAAQMEDRRIIAGILWKRLEMGMPLQVDAVFPYILGKNTFQLTLEDLEYDSPYNTYRYRGLPPGPIGNPGLNAILAAVTPIKTDYLFFLSDRQGNFHYSADHEAHVRLKQQYLGS